MTEFYLWVIGLLITGVIVSFVVSADAVESEKDAETPWEE